MSFSPVLTEKTTQHNTTQHNPSPLKHQTVNSVQGNIVNAFCSFETQTCWVGRTCSVHCEMREFCRVVELLFYAAVCIFWLVTPCSFITGYQISEARAASVFRVEPEANISIYRSCLYLSLISSFLF
jgi:hypothetical protein